MRDPWINMFLFGIGGMLFFMILGAFKRSSPSRKKQLEELKHKQESLKRSLLELSIKQVIALNGMYENFAITKENYYIELSKIYQQCIDNDIDISILKTIQPISGKISKEELKQRVMNTAVVLSQTNGITEDELNEIINKALDIR